jgi:hypothetical protein
VKDVESIRSYRNGHSVEDVEECLVRDDLSCPPVVQFYRAVNSANEYKSKL